MTPTTARSRANAIGPKNVPFFDYRQVFMPEEEELIAIFREVGRRGAFILQEDLVRFETHLTEFVGAGRALGVGNATDGLHIALRAAEIGAGDEVIFCSHTMVATAAAIHFAGATPVPVECGADHLIDPAALEAAVTRRTRAIVPTQLNGRTADMDALAAIAGKRGWSVIEDAAQALGARYKGRSAGTFGIAAAISFFPAKVLGCLGDGGAVIAGTDAMFEKLCQLRDHGRSSEGAIVSWGLNSRLDNLQAAILDRRLRRYGLVIERRRAVARLYRDALGDLAEVTLPPGPDDDGDHFDVYQNYEIEAERRDALREFLTARGVGTAIQWGGKLVHQWERLGLRASLPFTERMIARSLLLPMNAAIADHEAAYVAECVRGFYI
jgi:dTDP-4-amino-4,6-dideoxygalactose transaminase